MARAHVFPPQEISRETLCEKLRGRTAARRYVELGRLDLLLLRINPINASVLSFASLVERLGVPVLCAPGALVRTSNKAYLATLTDVPTPRTLVSRSFSTLAAFAADQPTGTIIKPARASGGRGIQLVPPQSPIPLEQALDGARDAGDGYIVAQEYLVAAEEGEKRLVWLDGRLLGGYLRRRAPGEFRHNLKQGGQPEPCEITPQDHALIDALTPHLRADGVWFAGVDVIGGQVVEVNTLNPGGLHMIQEFTGLDLTAPVIQWLEAHVATQISLRLPPQVSSP